MKSLSELTLNFKNGDMDAFAEIYNLTFEKACRVARKYVESKDVEDIVQDAYITMYQKIGTLENVDKIESWLNMIVKNKALNFRKQNEKGGLSSVDDIGSLYPSIFADVLSSTNPADSYERTNMLDCVREAISSLSDLRKEVIMMFYYQNLSVKEIADIINVNENTIKSRLLQARKDIEAHLVNNKAFAYDVA